MTNLANTSVLAVDGGGTRCRFALVTGETHVQIEAGPANVATDFEGSIATISRGFRELATKANTSTESLRTVPTYMSLAGIKGPDLSARLASALSQTNLRAEEDRVASLRGALGKRSGALIHAGTGSFLAVQSEIEQRFAGGWGPVLGDVGSAMWVGREALSATLDVEDGLEAASPLSRAMTDRFGGGPGIVAFAASATPADFGALAKSVMSFGEQGDRIVLHLMDRVSKHFSSTLTSIGWSGADPVTLTGGIAPSFTPYLSDDIKSRLIEPLGTPMDGAIALAQEFAREVRP